MIDVTPILKIAPIFAAALASPGPDFFMISSVSLSRGRWAGVQASAGIALGNFIWAALCTFGLGLVFAKMHGLMVVIRVCGGAYLVYLAYQLWKGSFKAEATTDDDTAVNTVAEDRRRHPFVTGLLTNATNPKALAFFTSIFAFALPKDASLGTQGAMLFMIAFMSILWFALVSYFLSTASVRKSYTRWSRWIDRFAGTFLGFFGARLLLSSKN